MTEKVKRFVITHLSPKYPELRVLTFPAQGRYTYETRTEAKSDLDLFQPSIRDNFGDVYADSLEVIEVECWPGHHDPCRTVF